MSFFGPRSTAGVVPYYVADPVAAGKLIAHMNRAEEALKAGDKSTAARAYEVFLGEIWIFPIRPIGVQTLNTMARIGYPY
ncbi:MAG TPA: hypothetical protein DEH78_00910 [Solibacterales bacterium]|nr:hypothetical protein [Bryobacterales bacterium]